MSSYRPYPKYKPSGVEWLGDVPEGWEVKPLKVVATFNDDVLPESFGEDEEIEYVDIGSVSLEAGIERTETFRFGDAPSRARRKVRDGDVIASTVRTYLKAIAPVAGPPKNLIVSTGFAVIRPRYGLNSHFAKFSLQSGYFVDEVISRSTGVSYPAINASEMAAISLSIPPLPEQHQIASFLDRECGKLDALHAKQERLIELLKEKRQALISHAVTRGLDPTAKLKPSGVEWLGEVPEHWIVTRLKFEVSKIVDCPHETPKYDPDGEYLVIRTADVDRGRLDLSKAYRLDRDEFVNRTRRERLHPNDIVYGREGERWGHAALVPESPELCLGQRMMQFRASRSIEPAFLSLLLNSDAVYKQGAVDTVGATAPHVNISTIRNYYFPLPPLAEQRAIVAHLDEKCGKIDQLKAKAERGIELLKERRSALISAAVTGKIDVRES
jgi:type I restriction enzyme, S subunit